MVNHLKLIYIIYCDEDIQHVRFWSGDLARRCRTNEISDTSRNFSEAMQFWYSHLSGICRRKVMLKLFGESEDSARSDSSEKCCDVCDQGVIQMENRAAEMLDAIVIEVKLRLQSGFVEARLTWMKDIQLDRNESSTYGKSPQGKPWWRTFIRQAAAAGYIIRTVKTAKFGNSRSICFTFFEWWWTQGYRRCSNNAP